MPVPRLVTKNVVTDFAPPISSDWGAGCGGAVLVVGSGFSAGRHPAIANTNPAVTSTQAAARTPGLCLIRVCAIAAVYLVTVVK
ncbi:hypothetical protein D3C83_93710 [compost metagenome]